MAVPDKLPDSDSIIQMEYKVGEIMSDVRGRLDNIYDLYLTKNSKVPKMPEYKALCNDNELLYNTSVKLTSCIDELLEVKMRVTLVYKQLNEIRNNNFSDRGNYNLFNNFKKNLDKHLGELDGYRFDILEIIKNVNNKFKLLEMVSYRGE